MLRTSVWQRRLLVLSTAIALCTISGTAQSEEPESKPTKYENEKLGFEITFPGPPEEKVTETRTHVKYMRPDGMGSYSLDVNSLPEAADVLADKDKARRMLDAGRDSLIRIKKAKLILEKEFRLGNKYPARDLEFDLQLAGQPAIMRTYVVLTPRQHYLVMVVGTPDVTDSAETKRFLDSLKIK